MTKLTAFQARRFTPRVEAAIDDLCIAGVNKGDSILTAPQLAQAAKGSEVIFVSATETVDRDVIEALSPTLRVIATLSVGYDHIDVEAAKSNGIAVLHTPDVLSEACAETALLLLLNACRRGYEADQMVRTGNWPGWGPTQMLGHGLNGRCVGIYGMGRIGREIAKRCKGFDLSIHYHNRSRLTPDLEGGAVYHDTLDELMAAIDFLVICVPGGSSADVSIDADRIAMLPRHGVVVNISRGLIIDDDALVAALQTHEIFAAGLDVFAGEPKIDPRYRTLSNIFMSPHMGSATHETRDLMGMMLLDGLVAIQNGTRPPNQLV